MWCEIIFKQFTRHFLEIVFVCFEPTASGKKNWNNSSGFDSFSIARTRLKRNNGIDYDIDLCECHRINGWLMPTNKFSNIVVVCAHCIQLVNLLLSQLSLIPIRLIQKSTTYQINCLLIVSTYPWKEQTHKKNESKSSRNWWYSIVLKICAKFH